MENFSFPKHGTDLQDEPYGIEHGRHQNYTSTSYHLLVWLFFVAKLCFTLVFTMLWEKVAFVVYRCILSLLHNWINFYHVFLSYKGSLCRLNRFMSSKSYFFVHIASETCGECWAPSSRKFIKDLGMHRIRRMISASITRLAYFLFQGVEKIQRGNAASQSCTIL